MSRRRDLHGVVIVDKPAGLTSAQVVAAARKKLGTGRIGHTGTLDPLATGVLPLCLGEGTKLASYLLADDKGYDAELELGVETDTYDAEGAVVARAPERAAAVTEADVRAALAGFTGDLEQVPPMYSALKLGGRRLHEMARDGVEIVRQPRPVTIHRLELVSFAPPRLRFAVDCSKGTYVRTLVADLGQALGCGAHLTALRRTRSGVFTIDQAVALDDLWQARVVPLPDTLAVPRHVVPEPLYRAILDGCLLPFDAVEPPYLGPTAETRAIDGELGPCDLQLLTPEGALAALARVIDGQLRPFRVFTYGLTGHASSANLRRSIASNP